MKSGIRVEANLFFGGGGGGGGSGVRSESDLSASGSPASSCKRSCQDKSRVSLVSKNPSVRKEQTETTRRKSSFCKKEEKDENRLRLRLRHSQNPPNSQNNNNNKGNTKVVGRVRIRSKPKIEEMKTDVTENLLSLKSPKIKSKFEQLWDIKTIQQGMIRVPTHVLEDLIHKEQIENIYDIEERPVASGLFATVRKCTHRETGITYAAKYSSRIRVGVDCSNEILHEIAMLSLCNESNKIVHLKDVFKNRHEIILVLEYAPGGDFQHVLDDDMVPFEQDVINYLIQVFEALTFIHERSIAHLDIKPQNIVLMGQFPNCEIKLCDLEVARVVQDSEEVREIIGTPDYVAPEILAMEPITLAADIWSMGVLAYVLLTGFSPFGGESDQETLRNIASASLDFPQELFEGVSDEAKNFISLCLNRDPSKRPSVKDCLSHSWLSRDNEPPSPSPLMIKIPTPDYLLLPNKIESEVSKASKETIPSRRSCQTCRDKITERKRYLSKSREAIFEKVAANSNLKKSLSKSKERLCDLRLSLENNNHNSNNNRGRRGSGTKRHPHFSRYQDKFYRVLSKSAEVLPSTPFGKSMVHCGAVSDISSSILQEENLFVIGGPSVLLPSTTLEEQPEHTALIEIFEEEENEDEGSRVKSESRKYSWREELDKFRSSSKASRVSDLIGTFNRSEEERKLIRRRSFISSFETKVQEKNALNALEVQLHRRKSTSALSLQMMSDIRNFSKEEWKDSISIEESEEISRENETTEFSTKESRKVSKENFKETRHKNWDYFEIDHPKAISDSKLQQLKAKYARRSETNVEASNFEESFLEVQINPLTGQISSLSVCSKEDSRLVNPAASSHSEDEFESLTKDSSLLCQSLKKKERSHSLKSPFLTPISKMCSGAFNRALERLSHENEDGDEDKAHSRRQSSPMLRSSYTII